MTKTVEMKEYDRKRQECNKEILGCIAELVEKEPYLRFGQILHILRISNRGDIFHEEPRDTVAEIKSSPFVKR